MNVDMNDISCCFVAYLLCSVIVCYISLHLYSICYVYLDECLLCLLKIMFFAELFFFFFNKKTAYDMRISDWSSDVCSSDLALAVALHVGLLQVCGELRQALIVRQHGQRAMAKEVDIPDTGKTLQQRQVLGRRGGCEMHVHLVRAGQQLVKAVDADAQRDRQADGGPQRIASADPVPELQHAFGRNPEAAGDLRIGRDADEMPVPAIRCAAKPGLQPVRSEDHTSELPSLM